MKKGESYLGVQLPPELIFDYIKWNILILTGTHTRAGKESNRLHTNLPYFFIQNPLGGANV